jgi:hypothetical protein
MDATHSSLVNELFASRVIDQYEKEQLQVERNPTRRCERLLSMISRKPNDLFDSFLSSLEKSNQHHIAKVIRGVGPEDDDDVASCRNSDDEGCVSGFVDSGFAIGGVTADEACILASLNETPVDDIGKDCHEGVGSPSAVTSQSAATSPEVLGSNLVDSFLTELSDCTDSQQNNVDDDTTIETKQIAQGEQIERNVIQNLYKQQSTLLYIPVPA